MLVDIWPHVPVSSSTVLNNLINQIILNFYAEMCNSFQIQKLTLSLGIIS